MSKRIVRTSSVSLDITIGNTSFLKAKNAMRKEVLKGGWTIEDGVSVIREDRENSPNPTWYRISQSVIEGDKKIIDYDIIKLDVFSKDLTEAKEKMSKMIEEKTRNSNWKSKGEMCVQKVYLKSHSYEIYQTMVKEQ